MINQPMYLKIYDDLISKIQNGVFLPGSQIPTENELCEQYAVSRITAKKALDLLSDEGYIERVQGKGSFLKTADSLEAAPSHPTKVIACVLTEFYAFSNRLLHSIEHSVSSKGDNLILKTTRGNSETEKEFIHKLMGQVDGFIIMPAQDQFFSEEILKLVVEKVPFVMVDRLLKGIPTVSVCTNNVKASEALISYLLKSGKKNIGIIAPNTLDTSSVSDRMLGYEYALRKHQLAVDRHLLLTNIMSTLPEHDTDNLIKQDIQNIKKYLMENKERLDTIFALEYPIALLIEQARQELNNEALRSIEIVCFDAPHSKYYSSLQYTHIMQDEDQIGKIAVEKLYDMFSHPLAPQTILIDGVLVKKTH